VSTIEREHGILCRFVFPRLNGRAINNLRDAWNAAVSRAGLEGSLIHDLRTSAARRYTAAGMSRGTAMALAGGKTEDIFNRYDIVSASDLNAGLKKVVLLRAWNQPSRQLSRTIGPRSGP
jgi:integrase